MLAVFDQGIACASRRDFLAVGQDVFQRAVGSDQRLGRLLPDAGNAGDVVRRVADERLVVGHVFGTEAVAFEHGWNVELANIAKSPCAR